MSGFSRDARGVSYRLKNLKGGSPEKYETGDFGGENTSSAVNVICRRPLTLRRIRSTAHLAL